jgi:hypothetical protein
MRGTSFVVIDFKGEDARTLQLWGTTREQVFDHEMWFTGCHRKRLAKAMLEM